MIYTIYQIKLFSIYFTNIFSHKVTEEIRKMSSRKIREVSEEENDQEQNKLLKSYIKYFKEIITELIHNLHDSSITLSNEKEYKLLVLTILAYSEELQQVII